MGGWAGMSAIPWIPSTRIPIVEGSKLAPPLGAHKPEWRHINVGWSIARLDALAWELRTNRLTLEETAAKFLTTPQEVKRLAREMGVVIRIRHHD